MKKFVIATMISAGVAMCAAVWPHGNAVEEGNTRPSRRNRCERQESDRRGNRNRREFCVTGRDGKRGSAARSIPRGTS